MIGSEEDLPAAGGRLTDAGGHLPAARGDLAGIDGRRPRSREFREHLGGGRPDRRVLARGDGDEVTVEGPVVVGEPARVRAAGLAGRFAWAAWRAVG
ncbi:hypothetical protein [Actinoplanes sp. N902-109]|uniref:hypothetical protein n=1 Tax=Actinoplanes sp. (strain N902-109) TaxID=649831 RepID=UPI001E61BD02|nr:hypothetical protein [Actinoplanes sp. N902-109]